MEFTSFCSGFRYIRRRGRKYAIYRESTIHGSSAQKRYQHYHNVLHWSCYV